MQILIGERHAKLLFTYVRTLDLIVTYITGIIIDKKWCCFKHLENKKAVSPLINLLLFQCFNTFLSCNQAFFEVSSDCV